MIRVLRAAALAVLVYTCAAAQTQGKWARIDDGDEQKSVPITTCGSLTSQSARAPARDTEKVETVVSPIGEIRLPALGHHMKVDEVVHRFFSTYGETWMKRIFVERAPGESCEIYRLEGDDGIYWRPGRPFIIDAEGNQILGTRSDLKGTSHARSEAYWVFDGGGPIALKPYEVAAEAMKGLIPQDGFVVKGGHLNIPEMCYVTPIWRPPFEVSGSFLAKFALKGTSLFAGHKEYTTTDDGFDRHEQECPIN